jgi:RHS repeat-associated protein
VYLHQGGRYDGETGLYDFRNRFYDPEKGRWLNLDPLGFAAGDSNLYRYEGGGPTNATDPSGLEEYPWYDVFLIPPLWRDARRWYKARSEEQELEQRRREMLERKAPPPGSVEWLMQDGGRRGGESPAFGGRFRQGGATVGEAFGDAHGTITTDFPVHAAGVIVTIGAERVGGRLLGWALSKGWRLAEKAGKKILVKAGKEMTEAEARALRKEFEVVAGRTAPNNPIDPNKLNHIFGKPQHNLGGLVTEFGSEANAYQAMQQAAEAVVKQKGITGVFEEVVQVGTQQITVRGNVVNGVVKIGTAFK